LSKLNVRRLATLLEVSEQYQCTEMDRLIALALPMLDFSNLRISYSPFDPDYIDRPVASVRIEKRENDDELPTHRHRKGQLVLAEHGSVMCRTSDGLWIVPAQSAVWVPGGVPHSNCVSDNGCVYCVFIDPDSAQLPKSCCMFRISPLLRELIFPSRHIAAAVSFGGTDEPPRPCSSGRAGCACRKSNPDVLVVQSTQDRTAKNVSSTLNGARCRRILIQR
jgi:hypothetical protein